MTVITTRDVYDVDMSELAEVWRECFGDGEEYVREFYKWHRDMPHKRAAFYGDKLVGMAHGLSAQLVTGNGSKPAMFAYAGGVLRSYRGKGVFRVMVDEFIRAVRESENAWLLAPSEASLIKYYRSCGTTEAFFIDRVRVDNAAANCEECALSPIGAAEYKRLRDAAFNKPGYVCWDEEAIAYALLENANCGGFSGRLSLCGSDYIVFGAAENGVLHIKETTLPESMLPKAVSALRSRLEFDKAVFDMPAGVCSGGERITVGMATNEDAPQCGYLNLLLN